MKRFLLLSILLIISVLLAFSFSSCGEVEDGGATPPATDSSGGVIAPDLVGGMKDSFVDTALTLDRFLSAYRYTVTFDSNGGTAIPAVKAREGGVIYSPRVPQKKNSVLVGWYLGERKWSFDTDTVTEDITLVARWERAPHTDGLRFSRDEGGYYVSGYDGTDCEVYFSPTHEGLPVVGIADFAFRKNAALQRVAIPSGVEEIGQMAFEGCTSLESISLPDTVTTIGKRAFSGCTSLEGLTLPSSVSSIGERALGSEGGTPFNVYLSDAEQWLSLTVGGIAIVNGSYRLHVGGTPLADLVIPEEVDKIGNLAFCGCVSLERVSALGELEEIGLWAFAECTELVSVALPDSVTKIGVGAFEGCTSLAAFNIPAGVATLDGAEFNGCTRLATVTLSPSLTHIGKSVFDGCSSLSSITLHEGIESIGEHAFRGCAELVTLAVPSTVTAIGREAFIGCTGLTTLTVAEGSGKSAIPPLPAAPPSGQ